MGPVFHMYIQPAGIEDLANDAWYPAMGVPDSIPMVAARLQMLIRDSDTAP
jgi:hypothetical protein